MALAYGPMCVLGAVHALSSTMLASGQTRRERAFAAVERRAARSVMGEGASAYARG